MVMCPPYPPDQVDTLSSRAPQPARFWPWAPEFGFLRPEPNADVPTEAINRFILTARDRSANCDRRDDGRAAYGICGRSGFKNARTFDPPQLCL